jgi:hypothetical protein
VSRIKDFSDARSEEQISMNHLPEGNDLKKFQNGKGVVIMGGKRNKGLTVTG